MSNEAQQEGKEGPLDNLRMNDKDRVDRNHQANQQAVDE